MNPGSARKHRRPRVVVQNLALTAVAGLLLFVALEIAARALYHPENLGSVIQFDSRLGWRLAPNATLRSVDHHRGFDYMVRINSHGLREHELTPEKPEGHKRILYFGDSVVFGTGVEPEWRFSDFIGRATEGVECINAGVPGWGTDQEWLFYRELKTVLDPDLVVLTITLTNDIVNNALDHNFLGVAPKPSFALRNGELTLSEEITVPGPPPIPPLKRVLRSSRALVFAKRRVDQWRQSRREMPVTDELLPHIAGGDSDYRYSHWSVFERAPHDGVEKAWETTEAIIGEFAAECRADGVDFLVFALPLKIEVDGVYRAESMKHSHLAADEYDFAEPFQRLETFCATNDIAYVGPLEEFRAAQNKRPLYFPNDGHANRMGHALAARSILRWMKEVWGIDYEMTGLDAQLAAGNEAAIE